MTTQWQPCSDTPEDMVRGSAVTHNKMAYFNPYDSTDVYMYLFDEDQWTTLPKCPYYDSGLAVVNSYLTTVGGRHDWGGGGATNCLTSLTGEGKDRKWVEHFPRMPTGRCLLAAVTSGRSLIAAGGHGGGRRLSTVEVLDMDSRQWTHVSSLPYPMSRASIAVRQGNLYFLGGWDDNGRTLSVFTCSIADLLQSQPAELEKAANQQTVWHRAADAPHYWSTAVVVGDVLLAIGGQSAAGEKTSAIVSYDPTGDSWKDTGCMATPRSVPLVVLLPSNELIVAGGAGGKTQVEIGKIVA